MAEVIQHSDRRLTVSTISVPRQIKQRSGRKLVTVSSGDAGVSRPGTQKRRPCRLALAPGHRWLALLESGGVKSLREITRKESMDSSYVSRMVDLTTLAPDTAAAILDETLPPDLTLFDLAVDPPTAVGGAAGVDKVDNLRLVTCIISVSLVP